MSVLRGSLELRKTVVRGKQNPEGRIPMTRLCILAPHSSVCEPVLSLSLILFIWEANFTKCKQRAALRSKYIIE